jgi:hypothetical protein
MAAPLHITLITDTRQVAREITHLSERQRHDYLAGRLPIWMDEEVHGDTVIITPRLCFG